MSRRAACLFVFTLFLSLAAGCSYAADFPFTVKGGRLLRDGEELACEVFKVRGNAAAAYWCLLEPDLHGVAEDEAGLWLFSADGRICGGIHFEAGEARPEITFSPGGCSYVITTGSSSRPDVFLHVSGRDGEKAMELRGLRDGLMWIDPLRVVYTRIDGPRENGSFAGLGYALKVSVAMYDTAAREETTLKEADARNNFWLTDLTKDAARAVVTEESVKSEGDWDDAEKIGYREIKVDIPAAG